MGDNFRIAKDKDGGNVYVPHDISYKKWYNDYRIDKALIGLKASNGLVINGATLHLQDRMIERSLDLDDIHNAIVAPLKIMPIKTDKNERQSQRFIGKKATVSVNPESGLIITAWGTGTKLVEKLRGGNNDEGI